MAVRKKVEQINFQETSEWQHKISTIMKLKGKGYNEFQIADMTSFPEMEVRRIFQDENVAVQIAKDNIKNKLPVIKDIIGMGLDAIREALIDMTSNPEIRAQVLSTPSQIQSLTRTIESLNNIARLEQDLSTQNVSQRTHTYETTRVALQELKKLDPIFDYPELPEKGHEQ